MQGKIKWYNEKKGYGFIEYESMDGKIKEVFMHYTNVKELDRKNLIEGKNVKFFLYETEKGLQAKEIEVL